MTVPRNGRASFNVTIDANPDLPERSIYGGYIVLTPRDGSAVYRVPFSGFKGDYQSTQVLTPTANGFPWLAQLVGRFLPEPQRNRWHLHDGRRRYPVASCCTSITCRPVSCSRRSMRVTGKVWDRVSDDEFVTRNSTPGGFFDFAWDGTTFHRKGNDAGNRAERPVCREGLGPQGAG
ncbi:MAG: hypothetical protein V9E93_03470 [Steroidobacteraceae bacterium]